MRAKERERKIKRVGISNNNGRFFDGFALRCSPALKNEPGRREALGALTASGTSRPVNFLAGSLLSVHPIYGPGEIACNANLLVVPLSLGQEGGPVVPRCAHKGVAGAAS